MGDSSAYYNGGVGVPVVWGLPGVDGVGAGIVGCFVC